VWQRQTNKYIYKLHGSAAEQALMSIESQRLPWSLKLPLPHDHSAPRNIYEKYKKNTIYLIAYA